MTDIAGHALASGQARVDKNAVYGMYSGLALLMDVYRPAQSNGHAIIVVPGSGWTSKQTYDATPLTALDSSVRFFVPKLLDAGYTLIRRRSSCSFPGCEVDPATRRQPRFCW
jgi:hypothetical protein